MVFTKQLTGKKDLSMLGFWRIWYRKVSHVEQRILYKSAFPEKVSISANDYKIENKDVASELRNGKIAFLLTIPYQSVS